MDDDTQTVFALSSAASLGELGHCGAPTRPALLPDFEGEHSAFSGLLAECVDRRTDGCLEGLVERFGQAVHGTA